MNHRIPATFLALFFFLSAYSQTGIRLKGSNSILPLGMKLASEYMKKNPGSLVAVSGGGSGIGISSMIMRTCDIAMSSRPVNEAEKNSMKGYELLFSEKIIALDGIAVIVNKENPVEKLTREQLAGIYTGSVTNWKKVGGPDAEIIVYSRLPNSGTHSVFSQKVLDGKEMTKNVLPVISNSAVVQYVKENKNAIGFACNAYVENKVKACSLSWDQGTTFIKPLPEMIRNNSYPLSRPLFFYFLEERKSQIQPFLDFLLTDEGKRSYASEGYILPE